MCIQNLKFIPLPVLEIVTGVLDRVANPQSSGREGHRGSGMERSKEPL